MQRLHQFSVLLNKDKQFYTLLMSPSIVPKMIGGNRFVYDLKNEMWPSSSDHTQSGSGLRFLVNSWRPILKF